MAPEQDIYSEAIAKLGYPGSAAGIKYLKLLFTPEEGRLLLEFIQPATCQEVAQRLNIDEKILQEKLDHFTYRRKLLYHGKTQYIFYLGLHAFLIALFTSRKSISLRDFGRPMPNFIWKKWSLWPTGHPIQMPSRQEYRQAG